MDSDWTAYISYSGMGVLALIPIYFGSFASLPAAAHEEDADEQPEMEILSAEDAYWFPILGSMVLFGFYLVFHFLSQDLVQMLILVYFSMVGTATVYHLFAPLLRRVIHTLFCHTSRKFISEVLKEGTTAPKKKKQPKLTKVQAKKSESLSLVESMLEPLEFKFLYNAKVVIHGWVDSIDVVALASAISFICYYNYSKNWIASNVLGESFSLAAIQWMQLDSFYTGIILLAGLFFYDIFWVFGTDVMVTVATSFDAPIKLLFPRDIFAEKYQFSLLGLGDIVIPGIFVALCLRYDYSRAGKPHHRHFPMPYFSNCMIAYILGLAVTIAVMHTFKAAQPALLYLSPACILSVLITAIIQGDWVGVFKFGRSSNESEETTVPELESDSSFLTDKSLSDDSDH